jgi:hypothetical protein
MSYWLALTVCVVQAPLAARRYARMPWSQRQLTIQIVPSDRRPIDGLMS